MNYQSVGIIKECGKKVSIGSTGSSSGQRPALNYWVISASGSSKKRPHYFFKRLSYLLNYPPIDIITTKIDQHPLNINYSNFLSFSQN